MRHTTRKILAIALAAACWLGLRSAAAHSNFSSANYIGVDDAQDAGGSSAASTNYGQLSAVGQTADSTVTSAHYVNYAGFLHAAFLNPTPTPSPTATPAYSPTATATPTASFTPSESPTATITPSITPTATMTPTITDTPEHTPTATPSITITLTVTATATASPTSTATGTLTLTFTQTPSRTITLTPTISPTPSHSPTISPTMAITLTATPTLTQTAVPQSAGPDVVCYPNPVRSGSQVHFCVQVDNATAPCQVVISLYNLAGEKAADLSATGQAGINILNLDTAGLSGGLYFYGVCVKGQDQAFGKLAVLP